MKAESISTPNPSNTTHPPLTKDTIKVRKDGQIKKKKTNNPQKTTKGATPTSLHPDLSNIFSRINLHNSSNCLTKIIKIKHTKYTCGESFLVMFGFSACQGILWPPRKRHQRSLALSICFQLIPLKKTSSDLTLLKHTSASLTAPSSPCVSQLTPIIIPADGKNLQLVFTIIANWLNI